MALDYVLDGICMERAGGQAVLVLGQVAASLGGKLPGGRVAGRLRIRYTFTRQVDGVQLAPQSVRTERGLDITGPAALDWLISDDAYQQPRADVFCLTLDGRDEAVWARALDLCRAVEPYVYPDQPGAAPLLLTDVLILSAAPAGPLRLVASEAEAAALVAATQTRLEPTLTRWLARTARCHVVSAGSEQTLAQAVVEWLRSET